MNLNTTSGCRLCLDPFGDNFTTIENLELQEQMKTVFRFAVEPREGFCSGVCQSCSYTVSEFHRYSERVRQNQELLSGKVATAEPSIECKPTVEVIIDSEHQEQTMDPLESKTERSEQVEQCASSVADKLELKLEVSDEVLQFATADDEPPLKKIKSETTDSDENEPTTSKQQSSESQEEIDEEDRLANEQFTMNCDLCNSPISSFNLLHRHFQEKHNRRRVYIVCCNKKYSKKSSILDHIHYHINLDAFRCKVCIKKFEDRETLNKHMQQAHSSENHRPHRCDRCPRTFKEKTDLDLHREQHKNIPCPQCDKFFCSVGSLKTHKINYHGKDRSKVCDVCGRKFKSKEGFQKHMNEQHMGIKVERLQCQICQRSLKGQKNLRNHLKVVHGNNEREFECDKCLHKFASMSDLKSHQTIVHEEAKHECKMCGKMFKRALGLKEHQATHTGEVLYNCEFCEVTTNCRANMYKHVKKRHSVEWEQKQANLVQPQENNTA